VQATGQESDQAAIRELTEIKTARIELTVATRATLSSADERHAASALRDPQAFGARRAHARSGRAARVATDAKPLSQCEG
jgi:hypothetical protein